MWVELEILHRLCCQTILSIANEPDVVTSSREDAGTSLITMHNGDLEGVEIQSRLHGSGATSELFI